MNEFEHLISELQQGENWSIYSMLGYFFLFVWWMLFLFKRRKQRVTDDY